MFLHHVHCFVFLFRSYRPCMLLFWAPVQWFCLLLWVHDCNSAKNKTRRKKNTLWVLLFDATIILVEMFPFVWTPPCVIKVPLCISSPSLSENLSCTLMRVCWWVWLIVGFALQMSCVPAVTLRPIVWRSLALLLPSLSSHLPVWQINEGRLSSFRKRASFQELLQEKLLHFSKCPTFLPVAGLLSSRIRPDCKTFTTWLSTL